MKKDNIYLVYVKLEKDNMCKRSKFPIVIINGKEMCEDLEAAIISLRKDILDIIDTDNIILDFIETDIPSNSLSINYNKLRENHIDGATMSECDLITAYILNKIAKIEYIEAVKKKAFLITLKANIDHFGNLASEDDSEYDYTVDEISNIVIYATSPEDAIDIFWKKKDIMYTTIDYYSLVIIEKGTIDEYNKMNERYKLVSDIGIAFTEDYENTKPIYLRVKDIEIID